MMNNSLSKGLFSLCMAAALLTSCQKNENDVAQVEKTYLVKTFTAGTDVYKYSYDDKGRLIKEERPLDGTLNFVYTDTNVIETRLDLNGAFLELNEYKLNANGIAKSCIEKNRIVYYSYNSAGQLTRSYAENHDSNGNITSNSEIKQYYTNSNLDSVILSYNTGGPTTIYPGDYYDEYYTDKVNTLNNANFGQAWLGTGSKNLMKKGRAWGGATSPMQSYTFTYEFDSLGRVIKVISSNPQVAEGASSITYY